MQIPREVKHTKIKSNGYFGIIEEPHKHKQDSNQQKGLDLYITLVNFATGEICHKKMYENTKGLHFKHSASAWSNCYSNGTHYLKDFNDEVMYIPFQIIEV